MSDAQVPQKFTVQSFAKLGTCAITTEGDWTLLCLKCGRIKKTVGSCTTPFVLHYPAPEYCDCDGPHINADNCMATVQELRKHLLSVNLYFNTIRPVTEESEHARTAVMDCWEDLIKLAGHVGGGSSE